MARDYKKREPLSPSARNSYASPPVKTGIGIVRWMLFTALIIGFVVFLFYLKGLGNKTGSPETGTGQKQEAAQAQEEQDTGPKPPQFDFYTILPKKEVVVPDYEIKTRSREERVGHGKETSYIVQAGSFNNLEEADSLRAKLAQMGLASKILKAKVGEVAWYSVKMGPFTQTASVETIRTRLKRSGIDVVVTETSEEPPKPTQP